MRIKLVGFIWGLLLLSPSYMGSEIPFRQFMIVWNVGQGQWATLKDKSGCHHFDMGGERSPSRAIGRLCGREKNFIHLSHWDWDHISFVEKSARYLSSRCLVLGPTGNSSSRKMKMVKALLPCAGAESMRLNRLTASSQKKPKALSSNDASHVLLAEGQFLLPGDSTVSQERTWGLSPAIRRARWILLGHHGSRTSTSRELLLRMPLLKTAVASARSRRYGHPHIEVVAQLRQLGIPLLRTEDWGNIWFEYREAPQTRVPARATGLHTYEMQKADVVVGF